MRERGKERESERVGSKIELLNQNMAGVMVKVGVSNTRGQRFHSRYLQPVHRVLKFQASKGDRS